MHNPIFNRLPLLRSSALLVCLLLLALCATSCNRSPQKTNGELEIVAIMPMTGQISYFGEQENWGLSLAVDEINAKGGLQGRTIRLTVEDTQGNPKNAVTIAQKYAANATNRLFFVTTSKAVKAVAPIADSAGIDTVAFCSDPDITGLSKRIVRPYMSFATEQQVIASFVAKHGWKKVAVVRGDDQAFANSMLYLRTLATTNHFSIVAEEVFAFADRDFRTTYQRIVEAKPDVIVALGWGFEVPALVQQYKEVPQLAGIPFVGGYTFLTDPALKGSKELFDGIYVVAFPAAIGSSKVEELRTRIQNKFGRSPNQFLDYVCAFDFVKMLAAGYEAKPNAQSPIEAVLSLPEYRGVSGIYHIDPSRDMRTPLVIGKYSNGVLISETP